MSAYTSLTRSSLSLISSLGPLGLLPVPMFGTLRQAASFAAHHARSLPRFAPWGAAGLVGGVWFVWPALTQDFKANAFGVGQTLEAAAEAAAAVTDETKATKNVDYSATGALQSFKTREGVKNKFAADDIDATPMNLDAEAVAKIEEATKSAHGDAAPIAESVDALRRFNTRAGAKFDYRASAIDATPMLGGGADEDEDEDDE